MDTIPMTSEGNIWKIYKIFGLDFGYAFFPLGAGDVVTAVRDDNDDNIISIFECILDR